MSSKRLVLLRHGQTTWNAEHRIQGQQDVELDDTGHAQAAAAAPYVAAYAPSLLWCSDLARARQTAAYVAKETGLDPTYDARLRESALGECETLTHEELAAASPEQYAAFRRGDWDLLPGAEGQAVVRERMVAALEDLRAALPEGGTGVAVSHGAALRVAVAGLLGWPEGAQWTLGNLRNCHWVELAESPARGGRLVLEGYGLTPISLSRD
ncbi:histidine phosphatase family protein [Nocardioides pantholopis]|uniref:histidine phosphatase family protein n=1 Tax=Nocardioides pantholopis TaxID=2483798 RepID=UPI000F08368A|nr:histidine phosphatase family protein [Nocardioides pantholopis]